MIIEPSARIDYCGECNAEHGYNCPKDTLVLTEEVGRRRVELIVYAAFMCGFSAAAEGRAVTHADNFTEIHNLIELISKDHLPAIRNKKS